MPTIIDGSASATFATPLPAAQGGTGNTTGNVVSSQIADALNATGSAPLYACRAWVNFNGTGTVAIRASGNVSSITDNGVGNYTVNFATAMPDTNYSLMGFARQDANSNFWSGVGSNLSNTKTVSAMQINSNYVVGGSAGLTDSAEVNISVFR